MIVFDITPCPAPRMTVADKWNKRPIVQKYFAFRNELRYLAYIKGLENLPSNVGNITFFIPMPESWSNRRKEEMIGRPHTQKPDIDNLLKGLLDGLCPADDSFIHSIGSLSKVWADKGSIELEIT